MQQIATRVNKTPRLNVYFYRIALLFLHCIIFFLIRFSSVDFFFVHIDYQHFFVLRVSFSISFANYTAANLKKKLLLNRFGMFLHFIWHIHSELSLHSADQNFSTSFCCFYYFSRLVSISIKRRRKKMSTLDTKCFLQLCIIIR